ncbi:peptidoglycan-binding protein [Actinopolymorpha sp. B11F2]|uniref:peptidoglycan-binding protein n=1 Tax=Actinopolymorpha sp. B11F2 TaxID=3160862 RepID=UPI0032E4462F
MTTTLQTTTIHASVGAGGTNEADDVRVVQDLLNRAADASLDVDGDCGPKTKAAIADYQKSFLRRPDGRVDPDGQTLRRLVDQAQTAGSKSSQPVAQAGPSTPTGGPTSGTRLQPITSARGWYAYSSSDRQFGTQAMITVLLDVAARLHRAGLEYGVGDISFERGGAMSPHKTHTAGQHADLRPIRTDGAHRPTSVGDPTYSRENTRVLVEALRANSAVTQILFSDEAHIEGVKNYAGHHNHLHIRVR